MFPACSSGWWAELQWQKLLGRSFIKTHLTLLISCIWYACSVVLTTYLHSLSSRRWHDLWLSDPHQTTCTNISFSDYKWRSLRPQIYKRSRKLPHQHSFCWGPGCRDHGNQHHDRSIGSLWNVWKRCLYKTSDVGRRTKAGAISGKSTSAVQPSCIL